MTALDARWIRQTTLPGFGAGGQERLAAAHVVVVGAGGLGCAVLPVLAAAGIGRLTVVDDDDVERSNLHRQTLYGPGDVGRSKAQVAAERLSALGARVEAVRVRVDSAAATALAADATLLVDATDDLDARYALDDAAATAGVPLVWGSAVGTAGQTGVADARRGPRWRDLFPVPPRPEDVATCAVAGVLPSLCTTVGGLMASEVLKTLTGLGLPLIGAALMVDAATSEVRRIEYGAADPYQEEERVASIEEIDATEAAKAVQEDQRVQLLDVRDPWEVEVAQLPGATVIPLGELADRTDELDASRPVLAVCHGGVRSLRAAQVLQRAGFDVKSVRGGIDAWSRTVDPSIPRY
ncbi:ThiF family adenylyltransferase [Amnibacterium endophyticum]|uniref:ThiF family adenylyltransferase n=1 Tax=Amnibacterium endophyticum TaxID=2109337 RepID=A0ABW4LCC9_9MICO